MNSCFKDFAQGKDHFKESISTGQSVKAVLMFQETINFLNISNVPRLVLINVGKTDGFI